MGYCLALLGGSLEEGRQLEVLGICKSQSLCRKNTALEGAHGKRGLMLLGALNGSGMGKQEGRKL